MHAGNKMTGRDDSSQSSDDEGRKNGNDLGELMEDEEGKQGNDLNDLRELEDMDGFGGERRQSIM